LHARVGHGNNVLQKPRIIAGKPDLGKFMMTSERAAWIEPEIAQLDVEATHAFPQRGADVGGNPFIDCQRS
jgi:hypothetical protein